MAWMNVVNPFAIAPRRRVVATALMYGLSLSVRFTSAAGEETEVPAHAVQTASPVSSIIFYKDWPAKPAPLIAFQRGSLLGSGGCRAACERPMPMSLMLDCPAP
jgi:hypothetical protein